MFEIPSHSLRDEYELSSDACRDRRTSTLRDRVFADTFVQHIIYLLPNTTA